MPATQTGHSDTGLSITLTPNSPGQWADDTPSGPVKVCEGPRLHAFGGVMLAETCLLATEASASGMQHPAAGVLVSAGH